MTYEQLWCLRLVTVSGPQFSHVNMLSDSVTLIRTHFLSHILALSLLKNPRVSYSSQWAQGAVPVPLEITRATFDGRVPKTSVSALMSWHI